MNDRIRVGNKRRATIFLMVIGLLAMLFIVVSAYITLARFDRLTLVQAQQKHLVDEMVDGVNDLVISHVRQQWADSRGRSLEGGWDYDAMGNKQRVSLTYSYEDTGGYPGPARGASFIASGEPVRDPTLPATRQDPGAYRYPAVSSLGNDGGAWGLDPETTTAPAFHSYNMDALMEVPKNRRVAVSSGNLPAYQQELAKRARQAWMDADGDGVADGRFREIGAASELVNSIANLPVRAASNPQDPLDPFWRKFQRDARYDVGVRVVSHGGLLSLGSPGNSTVWNRSFLTATFNGFKKDGPLIRTNSPVFNDLFANASAVEPLLRRRGGFLPTWRDPQDRSLANLAIPESLRFLEASFPRTFVMDRDRNQNTFGDWQRINMATYNDANDNDANDDWRAWHEAAVLDPIEYLNPAKRQTALNKYDLRHLTTAISFSDEVAREVDPTLPLMAGSTVADPGIYPGQLKFYLGDIQLAFKTDGSYDPVKGRAIIDQLAGYFREMLAGYKDWNNEAVEDREQAYMLAVNAVAFAAPRRNDGFVDVVAYADGVSQKTFAGYGPQPFLTQAILYDGDADPSDERYALAVELYNPNDWTGTLDAHPLYLPQFAVSLNSVDPNLAPPAQWKRLDGSVFQANWGTPPRLPGRTFTAIAIHGTSGDLFFDSLATVKGVISDLDVNPDVANGGDLKVNLWRQGTAGVWYRVDQLEFSSVELQNGKNRSSDWSIDVHRDTRSEAYWGVDSNTKAARWRMAVAFPSSDPTGNYKSSGAQDGPPGTADLGKEGPDPVTLPFGPTTPLYVMNAGATPNTVIHSNKRPDSFPTVGFLLFVPRFAHVRQGPAGGPFTYKPMGEALYDQWTKKNYDFNNANTLPPLDFGHMPAFDNTQAARGSTADPWQFSDKLAGRIPWGLLVYDYFTTLNPKEDANGDGVADIDLYRVPGRININAAPWYLLAQIPVIGPDSKSGGNLPFNRQMASPAFWSNSSNILVGKEADTTTDRFDPAVPLVPGDRVLSVNRTSATWHRLGPKVALAFAAYRDRVAYLPLGYYPKGQFVAETSERNIGAGIYRPATYGQIRRGGLITNANNPRKHGFVSVGELLNVAAADSQVLSSQYATENGLIYDARKTDFVRAVSLLALLDTQFLTTRTNTYTAYVSINDRENPQSSVRSQITFDRSNLLPRLALKQDPSTGVWNPDTETIAGRVLPKVIRNTGAPEIVGQREISYYNARYDE